MKTQNSAFTLVEMMIVLAVMAILAAIAYPSLQYRIIQKQIESVTPLVDVAKQPVAASWAAIQKMPADNADAGLPNPDKMVGNFISNVAIHDGVVNVTFGNQANGAIKDKILSFRPAIVAGAPIVPVAWICGNANTPDKMTVMGSNLTNIPVGMLPLSCRSRK